MMLWYLLLYPLSICNYETTAIMAIVQRSEQSPIIIDDDGFQEDEDYDPLAESEWNNDLSQTDSEYIFSQSFRNTIKNHINSRKQQFRNYYNYPTHPAKRLCVRDNNRNYQYNGYYPGRGPVRGYSLSQSQINPININSQHLEIPRRVAMPQNNNVVSLSQPMPVINSQNINDASLSQPMPVINRRNQQPNQPRNYFTWTTTLSGIKIRNCFIFKSANAPIYQPYKLLELCYVQEGNFFVGAGKVISPSSAINLWRDVFNGDNVSGCLFRPMSSNNYKNKIRELKTKDNIQLLGDLDIAPQNGNNDEIDWDSAYQHVYTVINQDHLTKKTIFKGTLGYKCFMENSKKLKDIIEKLIDDFEIEQELKALQETLIFIEAKISQEPNKFLYLKEFAWICVQRHFRKMWWFKEMDGERFKTVVFKALKAILNNLVFILTTFADMNHLCNLLKQNPYIATLFIDLPKEGSKTIIKQVMEQLKNGYMSSTKFDGFNKISKSIGLIVCSNEEAPTDSFTQNRLYEIEICDTAEKSSLTLSNGQDLRTLCPDMPTEADLHDLSLKQIVEKYSKLNYD
eukprot:344023_1